jgi:hypothetical protein
MANVIFDQRIQCIHTAIESKFLKNDLEITRNLNAYYRGGTDCDIDSRIKHRHEHAHFFSFNATGLSDIHSIFQNYLEAILELGVTKYINSNDSITLPFCSDNKLKTKFDAAFQNAINQVKEQEAYMFGYGSNKSIYDIFNPKPQYEFLSFFDAKNDVSTSLAATMMLHKNLVTQLLFSLDSEYFDSPVISLPQYGDRKINSRSVMEAYAITIEIVSEYIKAVVLGKDDRERHSKKRIPSTIDRVALEACFSILADDSIDIASYVAFASVEPELYWSISLVTFSALMVPAINIDNSVVTMGGIKQLNPAHRLVHILGYIQAGILEHPRSIYGKLEAEVIHDWINKAHKVIGDPWSLKFAKNAFSHVVSNPDLYDYDSQFENPERLSMVARYLFFHDMYGSISESSAYRNELIIPYVVSADKKVLANTSWDPDKAFIRWTYDNRVYMLQMTLSNAKWHSNIGKLNIQSEEIQYRPALHYLVYTLTNTRNPHD